MKTFYRPEMNVTENDSFSPSAGKPKAFIEFLKVRGHKLDVVSDFGPASMVELKLAHDPKMVEGILNLTIANGFRNYSQQVAQSLPFTTGSMIAAAQYAVTHRENSFSPTSGFHHAGHSYCGGFCTFNGLMVAALSLLVRGHAERIGIVDLDMHYGDGTADIIRKRDLKTIVHYTFGAQGVYAQNASQWVNGLVRELEKFKDCDVILYQAGGDPHIDDPLGGVLTTEQMAKRDEIVFEVFRSMGIPVAWNLAGGYQSPLDKVLALHETTYKLAA